jgi:beta-glucosidase
MMGAQAGGWTVSWQGFEGYGTAEVKGETIRTGMQQVGSNVTWDQNGTNLSSASKVVVVIGEYPYAEGNGDHGQGASSVYLADQPNYDVLTSAINSGKQVILVIISGRPMVLDANVVNGCDAIVAAWLPGSRGIGVADVLFGDVNFTGKLPHTWPESFGQIPINVGKQSDEPGYDPATTTPLYPYGHGLSY